MPDHNLRFYDDDPLFIFSQAPASTFVWTGPANADGKATITDNEAGADGLALNETGETATAIVDLNGTTSTNVSVYAEESWTIYDPVDDVTFQVVTLRVDAGGAVGYYTLSEVPLVAGRTYEVVNFDAVPDLASGDAAFDYADFSAPDHIVSGKAGADNIDDTYTGDPQNDQVDDGFAAGTDGNDNTIEGLAGDDTVDGGADDDSIIGGDGDDSLIGGTGDDTVAGGRGNDIIQGDAGNDSLGGGSGNDSLDGGDGNDTIFGGDGSVPVTTTEVLDWSLEGADGTSVAGGFT